MVVPASPIRRSRLAEFGFVCGAAVALTFVFWGSLWVGGGIVGGDVYTYFIPQKKYFVDHLRQGEFPLWNNLVGHGYPIVGESQTGVFYPFNLLFYSTCDVNTAYNAVQLLHYVLAFVFTWMLARRLNLSAWGAGFAALVYTYGWFPARISLEWAIIGGAWFPLALWSVEDYLCTRRWRDMLLLTLALVLQILPGHYNLAFITLLTLAGYIPLRLWFAPEGLSVEIAAARWRHLAVLFLAVIAAVGLTAFQWLPTFELKRQSQRAEFGSEGSPAYGHIPAWYFLQVVAPWWYFDKDFNVNAWASPDSPITNRVEAHLYIGLLTLGLLAWGLGRGLLFRDRRLLILVVLGLLALSYTPGWLSPLTKHLPGFSYFRGEGRYSIVIILAAAILAGASLTDLCARLPPGPRTLFMAVLFLGTTYELWVVGPKVAIAAAVSDWPLRWLNESPIRRIFEKYPGHARVFSQGANAPALLGAAVTPPYLGIGPAVYYSPPTAMPKPLPYDLPATPEQLDWLRRGGVTHVLTMIPLDGALTLTRAGVTQSVSWPVTLLWSGSDPLLRRAWNRSERFYLYELTSSRGRVAWSNPQPGDRAEVRKYLANRVEVEATTAAADRLILTDLAYPGWDVTIDKQPAAAITVEGMFRGVDVPAGQHRIVWTYTPRALQIGAAISGATLLVLAGLSWSVLRAYRVDRSGANRSRGVARRREC